MTYRDYVSSKERLSQLEIKKKINGGGYVLNIAKKIKQRNIQINLNNIRHQNKPI